jgi:CBS domain-containing protein
MGVTGKNLYTDKEHINRFILALIHDVKALEQMLEADLFENDVQRIGAEQEVHLTGPAWRPATCSLEVLKAINDPHFTTEHSRYNLEINLDPLLFSGNCFSILQEDLHRYLARLDSAMKNCKGSSVLVGILPTIRRSDLELDNLTPLPRYHLLNDILTQQRAGEYEFRIVGADELITRHNSIMFEGCNTSFQVHLQVAAPSFASAYNWAQAISGPVLSCATNSPIFLGKRLWRETRIALFQQSVDTRNFKQYLREMSPRVTFGRRWLKDSVTELFQEDLARYRVLVSTDVNEDSLKVLEEGGIPKLQALQLHNGTVYRWNRACYGITDGKPHLRIENRIFPSGPSIPDQVANAAFWLGLMKGMPEEYRDISNRLPFDHAKMNFLKAARQGLETEFRWMDKKVIPAPKLILKKLLPIAYDGLARAGIDQKDIDYYLGIIEERTRTGRTGSQWMIDSFEKLQEKGARYEVCVALTAGIVRRQKEGKPVHLWDLPEMEEAGKWINRYWKVEQIMDNDLYTVQEDDLVYFALNLMTWKGIRFIAVESESGKFAGLLTAAKLLEHFASPLNRQNEMIRVREKMIPDPLTIGPETLSIDALNLMRRNRVGCLPVIKEERLVGLLTDVSFMNLSEDSIQEMERESKKHLSKPDERTRFSIES